MGLLPEAGPMQASGRWLAGPSEEDGAGEAGEAQSSRRDKGAAAAEEPGRAGRALGWAELEAESRPAQEEVDDGEKGVG